MKRLLAIGAVAALATACGSAQMPEMQARAIVLKRPSVKEIAAKRERAAYREAKALLRRFVPPPGAARIRPPHPTKDGFDISSVGGLAAADGVTVDRSQSWRLPMSFAEADAYVRAHRPAGFGGGLEGWSTDDPAISTQWVDYSYTHGDSRVVDVAIAGTPAGRVVIRADASVAWIYPRGPQQLAPATTREVDIRAPRTSVHVTDPDKVSRIVRRFNALLLGRLDYGFGCNALVRWPVPAIDFVFRSASGARVASASTPLGSAGHCDPITLRVGQKGTLLVDRLSGPSFVSRVSKLLGVRLTQSR